MSSRSPFVPRILVAEDSPICRKLLEHALADQAYELRFAVNGREALVIYAEYRPDIVITDWNMPELSGLDLCRRIRESATSYTYIVLVTQNTQTVDLIEGLDAGADDYLTKPFDAGELLARVRVGCRVVQMSREIEARNALLEKAVRTDHLTGLPNRLAVEEFATKQLRSAIRYRFNLWVVVSDLDNFKVVNDVYGHSAGDEAVQHFSAILQSTIRASDICGRLGGDEFLMVISHGEKRHIVQTVERLRADLANDTLVSAGQEIQITASFGIAGFTGNAVPTLSELIARADKALYCAKAAGRNQVRVEIPEVASIHALDSKFVPPSR